MTLNRKLALIATIISVIIAAVTSLSLVGREARLVDVVILFFSGFGGGASLLATIRGKREPRR